LRELQNTLLNTLVNCSINDDFQIHKYIPTNAKSRSRMIAMHDNTLQERTSDNLLSVIVPITLMHGKLDKFKSWINLSIEYPIKIIVVHDYRDEETRNELLEIVQSHKSNQIEFKEGIFGNPGDARNFGIQFVDSEWIAFWDSDDEPNLKNVFNSLTAIDADAQVLIGNFITSEKLNNKKDETLLIAPSLIDVAINPGIWRILFRTSSISDVNFPSLRMAEDQVFLASYDLFSKKINFSDKVFYKYTVGYESQLTNNQGAISDLILSSKMINEIYLNRKTDHREMLMVMYARQILTAFRKGSFTTKMKLLSSLFSEYIAWDRKSKNEFFMSIKRIFKYIKNSKKLEDSLHFSIVSLTGGLGNQLFQLAAALSLKQEKVILINNLAAPRKNFQNTVEISNFDLPSNIEVVEMPKVNWLIKKTAGYLLRNGVDPRSYENFPGFIFTVKKLLQIWFSFALGKRIKLLVSKGVGFQSIEIESDNYFLIGYFQSYKWIEKYNSVTSLFKLASLADIDIVSEFKNLANQEMPLCVHVRLGDYKNENNFGIPSKKYYAEAIREIITKGDCKKIWLFSDETEIAIDYIPEEYKEFVRIIPRFVNDSVVSLEIMRCAKNYVIGNSTFSWWGAYLSHNVEARVIAPNPWFERMPEPKDLIPIHWERRKSYFDTNL